MLKGYTRSLITGGTGYVGGWLAARLLQDDCLPVRILARTPAQAARLQELGADVALGDITDPASVQPSMARCDLVFHAAAWVGEGGAYAQVAHVNVHGARVVLDAASAFGVRCLVHLSTCAVYGSRQRRDIDETTSMRLTGNAYGDSKVAAEELLWQAHSESGFPVVVARPSQVYGLDSPQFTLRPIEAIRSGKMMLIDGGRHLCKPIYIDNLVDGLILCATRDAAVGQAFNFSDGEPVPWRDFFGAYARMLGQDKLPAVPYPLAWVAALFFEARAAMRGQRASVNRRALRALRSSNSFSNHKARATLGWNPVVDLQEGMRRTELFLREHGHLDTTTK